MRLSRIVRQLGYSESPLSLAEWLRLRQTIRSSHPEAMSKRLNLPPAIVSCGFCRKIVEKQAFEIAKSEARGLTRFYCSNECWGRAENERRHGLRKCDQCGALAPRGVRRGSSVNTYCSTECLKTAKKAERAKRLAARPWKTCAECEGAFQPVPALERYRKKRGQPPAQFCGTKCASRAHARRMLAQKNPAYRHGLADTRKQPHAARAFREVRIEVLERDGSRCAICAADEKLHVHHINMNPLDNRWRNLITLCAKCHKRHHADAKSMSTSRLTRSSELMRSLSEMAVSRSMTFRSQKITTSSRTGSSSTTASSSTT